MIAARAPGRSFEGSPARLSPTVFLRRALQPAMAAFSRFYPMPRLRTQMCRRGSHTYTRTALGRLSHSFSFLSQLRVALRPLPLLRPLMLLELRMIDDSGKVRTATCQQDCAPSEGWAKRLDESAGVRRTCTSMGGNSGLPRCRWPGGGRGRRVRSNHVRWGHSAPWPSNEMLFFRRPRRSLPRLPTSSPRSAVVGGRPRRRPRHRRRRVPGNEDRRRASHGEAAEGAHLAAATSHPTRRCVASRWIRPRL